MENYRVTSVGYRFFRPGSYFQARDNRLTVTLSYTSNVFKTFILDTPVMQGVFISGKLPSSISCVSIFISPGSYFHDESQQADCDVIALGQTFPKHLFWTSIDASDHISGKLHE